MKNLIIIALAAVALSFAGCEKEGGCYDRHMEENHSGICTQDCPGVCGCDGKTYCNACIANSHGITVVSNSPCE
jgi:hypothetical protein